MSVNDIMKKIIKSTTEMRMHTTILVTEMKIESQEFFPNIS